MTGVETTPAAPASRQSRGRAAVTWALLVLTGVLLLLSVFALWVNRVALDTEAFTRTSSELLADDAIRSAIATTAVDQLYDAVDVQAEIEKQLPEDFKSIAGLASAGARQAAYEVLGRGLEQPALEKAFATAVEQAHTTLVDVLEGGKGRASTEGGVVTLDLREIVLETSDRIGIRSRVEDALPEDVGRIEILRSDQLDTAQDAFGTAKALAWFLPLLTLGALGLAIWVSRDRRRTLRGFGFTVMVTGLVGLVAMSLTGGYLVDSLAEDSTVQTAARNAWDILDEPMRSSLRWMVVLGSFVVLAAILAGPSRRALAIRESLAPVLRERVWPYAGLAVFALALLTTGPDLDFARLLWIALIVALGAVWIETMRRRALQEFPDAALPAFVGDVRKRLGAWWSEGRSALSAGRPAARSGTAADIAGSLASLADLHSRDELTDQEYAAAKAQVLGDS
jgi:hypothetical protein